MASQTLETRYKRIGQPTELVPKRWNLTACLIAIMACLFCFACAGQDIDCGFAFDRTPQRLFSENEIVTVAELIAVDTLVEFGQLEGDFEGMKYYLLEHAFRPKKLLKARDQDSIVYLWYVGTGSQEHVIDGGRHGTRGSEALIYGNVIDSPDEMENCVLTRISERHHRKFPRHR